MFGDDTKDFLGKGFKFPLQVNEMTGRFEMVSGAEDIKESIYIILNTRIGERPMRHGFGCRIHDYIFEAMDYTVLSSMADAVREALMIWEPRIRDIEVESSNNRLAVGIVDISIKYIVRSTNNPYNLVFPFYLNEGQGAGENQ